MATGDLIQDDPVTYIVEVAHWVDGQIDVTVKGVDCEHSDRLAIAIALRKAADLVEQGTPVRSTSFN